MTEADGAIGVFDSGVGGLTVLQRIVERCPHESTVYLGDTARVPYGTKSAETVIRYARACARLLCGRDIKLMVAACNTASAYAVDDLRDELPIPVVGVIEPGAEAAVQATRNGRIGVVATASTVRSGRYEHAIHAFAENAQVFTQACPLFVPLAEEGWTEGPVPEEVARTYLAGLVAADVDTLLLGCTHYPLLKNVIRACVPGTITLIDSAEATSRVVADTLKAMGIAAAEERPERSFLVTDDPSAFTRVGERFFGHAIENAEWVDFNE